MAQPLDGPVRLAVVGCGYWGPNLVRNFARARDAELVALCDLDEERLNDLRAHAPAARAERDYERLLEDPQLDAVVIATPPRAHYAMALEALRAGKHVYVEKPLCLNSVDARRLVDEAAARNLTLMVGHLLEYHPAVEYLRRMIQRGEMGDIQYLYCQRLNLGQVRSDENALWSLAPHDVSVANLLLGDTPLAVSANGQGFLQAGVHDVVFMTLRYPQGRMAHVHVSWLDPHKTRQMTVVGTRRMAVFDDMAAAEKIRLYDKGVDWSDRSHPGPELGMRLRFGDVHIPWIDVTEPLRLECQHFVDCLTSGTTPRSDGWDGLRIVEALEAADESLRRGGEPVALGAAAVAV